MNPYLAVLGNKESARLNNPKPKGPSMWECVTKAIFALTECGSGNNKLFEGPLWYKRFSAAPTIFGTGYKTEKAVIRWWPAAANC
jgi:hypothetical protein